MSDEADIQIIDFSTDQKKKTKKKKGDKKVSKIEKAAEAGDEERAEIETAKKVNLLVAEGHVTYEYQGLLDRISTLLKDKNQQITESSKLKSSEDPHVVKLGTTKTAW